MYEKPNLNHVGNAQDVILGMFPGGDDLDGTLLPGMMIAPGGDEEGFSE